MEIWEYIQSVWIELVATGGIGFLAIKTFVFDKIQLKKNEFIQIEGQNKWLNRLNFVASEVNELKSLLVSSQEAVNVLTKENSVKDLQIQQLANLVVETLAVANVPLGQKERFHKGLNQISIISENASELLKGVIEHSQAIENQKQSSIKDNISKMTNGV